MEEKCSYQINAVFRLTGRGIVFLGNISSGSVDVGDWIEFEYNGILLRRKIAGINSVRSIKEENNCGLTIETISEQEIEDLRNWQPNHLVAKIFETTNEI